MTDKPIDNRIAARMADHYARQIEWVESSLAALDSLSAASGDADWDVILAGDASRAKVLDSLEAEYAALRKEWDATPAFLPGERNKVRALAARVRELGAEYQRKLELVLARMGEAGTAVQTELGALRKARDLVHKFIAGGPTGGGFVDRRA